MTLLCRPSFTVGTVGTVGTEIGNLNAIEVVLDLVSGAKQ